MTWLEVPLLLGICGYLLAKLIDFEKRIDLISDRLVRIETILIELPVKIGGCQLQGLDLERHTLEK